MIGRLLYTEIKDIIAARDFDQLRESLINFLPADIGDILMDLPENDQAVIFRVLPHKLASDVFEFLDVNIQMNLIKALGKEEVSNILNEMAPDARTSLLEELPASVIKQIMLLLSKEEQEISKNLLGYPEGSIGRLMNPDYFIVKRGWSVEEVLEYIRKNGHKSETLNMLYVVDEKGKLLDDIDIHDILLSPIDKKVNDLMDEIFVSLSALESEEKAVAIFRKYHCNTLPVVNSYGFLLGVVTIDDVLDVAEDHATEDIHMIGGMEALETKYITTSFPKLIRKRAIWLVTLFLSEMLTASAMAFFENEIAKAVVLALFVPLIISSGGNSGSQASSLIIRALALGEVSFKDWYLVMRREIFTGITLGIILGIIGFLRISIWSLFTDIYGPHYILIALTVGFALVGVVLWGTIIGAMLPIILNKIGIDPAASSAPFVATLVDVTGIIIYFSMAYLILHGTLL